MLRAVGLTRRQTRRMVRHESIITALIGAGLGLPLGTLLAARSGARAQQVRGRFSLPIVSLVRYSLLAVSCGTLAAIVPGPPRGTAERAQGAAVRVAPPTRPLASRPGSDPGHDGGAMAGVRPRPWPFRRRSWREGRVGRPDPCQAGEDDECVDHALQMPAPLGDAVDDPGWAGVEDLTLEQPASSSSTSRWASVPGGISPTACRNSLNREAPS